MFYIFNCLDNLVTWLCSKIQNVGRDLAESVRTIQNGGMEVLGGFIVGATFAAVGAYLVVEEGQRVFGSIFGGIGALYVGGGIAGRFTPLRIWGPSGSRPELGTKAAIEAMEKMYLWDLEGRIGQTDVRGFATEVTEFDYKKVQVVYNENGVKITAFPAIHAIDGSVSYRLDWNGLSFVFSSDTYPNKWFVEQAKDADLVVHECFIAVPDLVAKYRDERLESGKSPSTVRLELSLLSHLFTIAIKEWRVGLFYNPVANIRKPAPTSPITPQTMKAIAS